MIYIPPPPIVKIRSSFTHPWLSAACVAAIVHRNNFFCLYQQNKFSKPKLKFIWASNYCNSVLEAGKFAFELIKQKSIISQKLNSCHFWQIANSVLNKGKSAIPPLFNSPELWSSVSDKATLFAKNFSRNSNLDDSGVTLTVFPSRTYVKLNVSLTPKLLEKVITNLDLSKASKPYCIQVVVLKNCKPEVLCIPAGLFNICLI